MKPTHDAPSLSVYLGLFFVALSTLMYEILLTRIFSVTMMYHFAFVAPGFSGGSDAPLAVFQQPPNGGPAAGSWVFTLHQDV